MRVEAEWSTLKAFIDNNEAFYNYVDAHGTYEIIAVSGIMEVAARIAKAASPSADQTDFENNYKTNADNIPLDGVAHKTIEDVASSTLTYKGSTIDTAALDTESVWNVSRVSKSGGKTTEEFATGVNNWSKKFSDRATIFPTVVFDNILSTLYDGINDYINYGNVFNYDHSNAFSISVWVRPDNIAAARHLFAKSTNDGNVYGFNLSNQITTGALFLQMRASGSLRSFTFDTALTAGAWQHVVLTFSGNSNINGARAYRNAVVGTTPGSGTIGASWLSGQDFTLGSRNTLFEFSGHMTQFTVWNKALSQSEVTAIYNAGVPSDPTTESFESDLVTWSRMGDGDTAGTVSDSKGTNDGTMTNFSATPFVEEVP